MFKITLKEGSEGWYCVDLTEQGEVGHVTEYMAAHYAVGFLNGVISGLELGGECFEIKFEMKTTQESSRHGLGWLQSYFKHKG